MGLMATMDERLAICTDHGRTVQTVKVYCMSCGDEAKKECDHNLPNAVIARRCFPRWKVRGVKGARKTLCPSCKPK